MRISFVRPASASFDSLNRSDTLEHCLICVSFIFYMIPVLKFVFTHRMATFCTSEILFFAMLTIGQVLYISRSNTVSLGLRHQLHLLRHDRCTVLFSSQLRFLLNLIILVWLSSCMWYLSCRLSNGWLSVGWNNQKYHISEFRTRQNSNIITVFIQTNKPWAKRIE